MKEYWGKARQLAITAVIAVSMLSLFMPSPVQAQGMGLSGNFYRQHFELCPGETSPEADIYVVVSNPTDSAIRVKMVAVTPEGVQILPSQDDFALEAGGQQKVNIRVQVSQQAVPGEYTIVISAEAYREGTGIKITAAAQQEATLSVLGEAGRVTITAVTDKGEPFPALVGVYQEVAGELSEIRPLKKGKLEARLVPGDYIAQAHYQDIKLAEESFSLAADEEKEITLVCYTLLLSEFSVSPVYSDSGELASARIEYTIANLLEPLKDVKAVLKVEIDDKPLDEVELVSFSNIDIGTSGGNYNYIPSQGWKKNHSYSFVIELYAAGELRYQSPPQELTYGKAGAGLPGGMSWPMIGGIIAGVAIITVVVVSVRRRRRDN